MIRESTLNRASKLCGTGVRDHQRASTARHPSCSVQWRVRRDFADRARSSRALDDQVILMVCRERYSAKYTNRVHCRCLSSHDSRPSLPGSPVPTRCNGGTLQMRGYTVRSNISTVLLLKFGTRTVYSSLISPPDTHKGYQVGISGLSWATVSNNSSSSKGFFRT